MNERNQETNPNKKTYLLALVIGIFFSVLGIILSVKPIKLLILGEKTTGTIVGVTPHEREDDDGEAYYTYTPIIEYTCGGQKVKSEASSSSSKQHKIGRSITVFCDPKVPNKFSIPEDFFVIIVPIMGFIAIFSARFYAMSNRTQHNKKYNISGNLLSTVVLFFGFLIFFMLLCYIIYSCINDGIDGSNLICIILFPIPVRFLLNGLIIKLKDYIRINTAKSKIEKGSMVMIQATVIGFQHTADVLDKSYYQIKCSDGTIKYDSEEIEGEISGHDDTPMKYLEMLEIIYDPKNPQRTLEELDAHPKYMMIPSYYEETSQRLTKQIAAGEDYEYPYGIFNGKKVTVGDSINVYIDPNNRKLYLVDLSFLK